MGYNHHHHHHVPERLGFSLFLNPQDEVGLQTIT
jgi:hypothetical protein